MSNFWVGGFWATGFWSQGFWGDELPAVVPAYRACGTDPLATRTAVLVPERSGQAGGVRHSPAALARMMEEEAPRGVSGNCVARPHEHHERSHATPAVVRRVSARQSTRR
jgi:hypothetical protein